MPDSARTRTISDLRAPTVRARPSARRAFVLASALRVAAVLAAPHAETPEVEARVDLSPALTTLRPGARVSLSWGQLPRETEEFELLLVSDSPARLKLRLTESMDPALGPFAWRVPNVPCTRARIVVRMGDEDEEREWAESAPFRIAWDDGAPGAVVRTRGGELWLADGPSRAPGSSMWEGGPALDRTLPGRREEARGLVPTKGLSLAVSSDGPFLAAPTTPAATPSRVVERPSSTLPIPLRI